ncbi:MAG: SDR family NAD(P)-dependent oxidoreductase [Fimbriimonas sp.]|nr:SDR family NAD(P)-dependent oxidoreductase [Fimbriimonas sp.]
MKQVVVLIRPGLIGRAIARRVGVGKHILLANRSEGNCKAAAEVLGNAGYETTVATIGISSREEVHALVERATSLGEVTGLIQAAGASPSQASPEIFFKVDLCGTALDLEKAGNETVAAIENPEARGRTFELYGGGNRSPNWKEEFVRLYNN